MGRSRDFDRNFLPIQKHTQSCWVNIAVATAMDVGLPLIDLVRVNGVYYVKDGHHRISVAKAFGALEIEAEVTVWDTSRMVLPEIPAGAVVDPTRPDELKKAA